MPQTDTSASRVYRISDLDIDSVGLVPKGAVSIGDEHDGKNFFLFKALGKEEDDMPDNEEVRIEEVPEQDTEPTDEGENIEGPNWLEKAKAYADGLFAKRQEEDEPEEDEEEVPAVETPANDAIGAVVKVQLDRLQEQYDRQVEQMEKVMAEKYEAQLTDLQGRVEKAEQDAQTQLEKRQQREWLEKATNFRVFPVSRAELGEKLFALAKALPDDINWWVEALKAADQQMFAAGLFNEMGTSRIPEEVALEEKVEKAQEEGDPAKALLDLSREEQEQLLRQSRGGV